MLDGLILTLVDHAVQNAEHINSGGLYERTNSVLELSINKPFSSLN